MMEISYYQPAIGQSKGLDELSGRERWRWTDGSKEQECFLLCIPCLSSHFGKDLDHFEIEVRYLRGAFL